MYWIERVLLLLVTLSGYAAYFKFAGRFEVKLEKWITPHRASRFMLSLAATIISFIKLIAVLLGISCSVGFALVIIAGDLGASASGIAWRDVGASLGVVSIGCASFAIQSAIDRLLAAEGERQQWENLDALVSTQRAVKNAGQSGSV